MNWDFLRSKMSLSNELAVTKFKLAAKEKQFAELTHPDMVLVRREDLFEAIWVLSHGYTEKYEWARRLKAALEEKP